MLFGLDDNCQLTGIEKSLEVYAKDNWNIVKVREYARRQVQSLLREYISPRLHCRLYFGELDGKRVAYLLIPPATDGPFCVSKDFDYGITTPLFVDDCWIRHGESKDQINRRELRPEEDPFRYAYSEVPHILPRYWVKYFGNIKDDKLLGDAAG